MCDEIKICPICNREMEDTRHVGVECFYAVNEYIPDVIEVKFMRPVSLTGAYWGITRTYHNGTKDKFICTEQEPHIVKLDDGSEYTIPSTKIDRIQESLPEDEQTQRFLEIGVYQMTCCKSCRADFLEMLTSWRKGRFINLYEKVWEVEKQINQMIENIVNDDRDENGHTSMSSKNEEKYNILWKIKEIFTSLLKWR